MNCIAVTTTVGNVDEARSIARSLVERRLAASAQISQIESFYTWEGTVQNRPEYRLLLKTTQERYAEVENAIRELHSYELPAIHACRFTGIYAPYARWIAENVD